MNDLLRSHEKLSDESRINVVMVQVAHRSLKRYFNGELRDLEQLSASVVEWLERHGFIEAVITEASEVRYEATDKAYRAMLVAA